MLAKLCVYQNNYETRQSLTRRSLSRTHLFSHCSVEFSYVISRAILSLDIAALIDRICGALSARGFIHSSFPSRNLCIRPIYSSPLLPSQGSKGSFCLRVYDASRLVLSFCPFQSILDICWCKTCDCQKLRGSILPTLVKNTTTGHVSSQSLLLPHRDRVFISSFAGFFMVRPEGSKGEKAGMRLLRVHPSY